MVLNVVRRKTPHPCAGLTPAQRRDFELIATGHHPKGGYTTIKRLTERGLIEEGAPQIVGRDQLGLIKRRRWEVPTPIHIQWCKWCDEQQAKPGPHSPAN